MSMKKFGTAEPIEPESDKQDLTKVASHPTGQWDEADEQALVQETSEVKQVSE